MVENYGMARLKRGCCGWEIGGEYGRFEHSEFKKIHPFLMASVTIYAAGITDEYEIFDRNRIDYFYVTVELSIV